MDEGKEFTVNDPIHGMICFKRNSNPDNPEDIEGIIYDLINTKEFQRLRRIKQLGAVDYVYPGATHTRFSHSIGVAWLVYNAVSTLLKGWTDEEIKNEFKDYNREQVIIATTCAGLLHDIGHGPFGHTLDEKIYPLKHEKISAKIIKSSSTDVSTVFNKYKKFFPETYIDDIAFLISNEPPKKEEDSDIKCSHTFLIKEMSLLPVKDLISSQLDCDRLDYLMRDTYYCGTPIRIDTDYIIRNMMIKDVPHVGHKKIVIKEKAITAIEHYLLSRSLHYKQVAFHKTCMASEALITRICDYLIEKKSGSSVIKGANDYLLITDETNDEFDKFLEFDDYSFISYAQEKAKDDDELKYLLNNFNNRHLPKKHGFVKHIEFFVDRKGDYYKELFDSGKWRLPSEMQNTDLSKESLVLFKENNYVDIYEANERESKLLNEEYINKEGTDSPSKSIDTLQESAEKWIFLYKTDINPNDRAKNVFNIIEISEIASIAIGTDKHMYYFRDPNFKEIKNESVNN